MVDFKLSEEQTLLKDSVERFLADEYSLEKRRALVASEEGFNRTNWKTFADLGWLAVPFAEANGGLGGGPVEIMVLMESFGRSLVVEPYLHVIVTAASLIETLGAEGLKASIMPEIISGQKLVTLAHVEPQARYNLSDVVTKASKTSDGFKLSGHKAVVFYGGSADHFVVSARTSGNQTDESGISLFLVDSKLPGITKHPYPTIDGLKAAEVIMNEVEVSKNRLIGDEGSAFIALEAIVDNAITAACAEAVGIMDSLHEQTLEYLNTREQFGTKLGKFQALQHRSVDMFVACQEARSMVYLATLSLKRNRTERIRAVSAAKAHIGQKGRLVGQEAVQMHGGMGMTDELAIGHYFKRLTMIDTLFGNSDFHLERFASITHN